MKLADMWAMGLTPSMIQKGEEQLGETPAVRARALKEMKEMIKNEEGFSPFVDDSFLLRFLRAKKFDVKRSMKTFKNYYDFKSRYSGTITDLLPSDVKEILKKNAFLVAPKRAPSDGGVIMVHLGLFDDDISTELYLGAGLVCGEVGMETEGSQVCGSHVLVDLSGINFFNFRRFTTPSLLTLVIRGVQDCWPYRIRGIHLINEPKAVSLLYSVFKPMLSSKIRERLHFHGSNLESLHEFVPPACLPESLGGIYTEKDYKEFREIILNKEDLMVKINNYVYKGKPSQRHTVN